jgi:hypothetical protein
MEMKTKKGSVKTIVIIVLIFIVTVGVLMSLLKRSVQMKAQQAISAQQNQVAQPKQAQPVAPTAQPVTQAVTPTPADETANWQKFTDAKLGFEVKYPAEWGSLRDDDKANGVEVMVFAPKTETPSISVTINKFQNDTAMDTTGMGVFIKSLEDGITSDKGKVYDDKAFVYTFADGTKANGRQFTAEYSDAVGKVKQLIVAVPNGKNLFWMTYVSDFNKFDEQNKIASAMLGSWKITK